LREFDEQSNSDGSVKMRIYDLSLKSGQHEFITAVSVIIPCTTVEGEEGSLILYNSETQEWEYVYYEMTADGDFYQAYLPHFSALGEKKISSYLGTENDIRIPKADITTKGNMYQYGSFTNFDGDFIPLNERSVYMSDANFRKLFDAIKTDGLIEILEMANLPSNDSIAFALGTLNDVQSLSDGMILVSQADAALSATGKIRLTGAMSSFGGLLTFGRIAYQANKGGSFAAIIHENKYNIVESLLGGASYGASYVGAAAASTAFSVAAAVVFATSCTIGYYDLVTQYGSLEEITYNFFLESGKVKYSKALHGVSLQGDFKLGIDGENFALALKDIYDTYGDNAKELDEAISNFYNGYAGLFWNSLTEQERSDFYYNDYMNKPIIRNPWEEPSQEKIDEMKTKIVKRVASESEQILRAFARDALLKMYSDLYNLVKREVEPFLNEKIVFVVNEKSLDPEKTFDQSTYADYPIEFSDRKAPQFTPKYIDLSAYTDDKYTPKAKETSNIIYQCTMFHYIQMGCPTTITFKGNPQMDIPEQTISFKVDAGEVIIDMEEVEVLELVLESEPIRPYVGEKIVITTELIKDGYYVWQLEDEVKEGVESPSVFYRDLGNPGDKNLTLTIYKGFGKDVILAKGEMTIEVRDVFTIEFEEGSNIQKMEDERFQLTVVPRDSQDTLERLGLKWEVNGSSIVSPDDNYITLEYNHPGTYDVSVQAVNMNGVVCGKGYATLEIVELETDSSIYEYAEKYDKGYFTYDYDKFEIDERPGSVSIQEHNYVGGIKMYFWDDENTQIRSVWYYLSRDQVDYARFLVLDESPDAGINFEESPHILAELERTAWVKEEYKEGGGLLSIWMMTMTEDDIIKTLDFFE
ncbi:MAG: hypothetical protein ACTSVO_14150, partial [Candidatus Heimdallarchaeaceae archaeon]